MEKDRLGAYRGKRCLALTNEPAAERGKNKNPRFCVQRHAARALHYDFRLEWEGVALSWAVPKGPSLSPADKRLAMRVEDHPVGYLSFEGIIPKGEYGGGTVMLWDEGEWAPLNDFRAGLESGSLKFTLFGERMKGGWTLVRMKGKEEGGEPWLLIKEKDKFARGTAGFSRESRSVLSGRTMREIAEAGKRNPFVRADAMLAKLTETLPKGGGWLYELKYDGHRTFAFADGDGVALKTRNGCDCTQKFAPAAEGVKRALGGRAAVLDGEMTVAGQDGRSDFGALQSYAGGEGLCYILFDLLALDGEDLRLLPLSVRKQKLEALLEGAPPVLKYSGHLSRLSRAQCEKLKKQGAEGIVIKRADSPYSAGKNGDWLKLKFRNTREFVVGGYALSETGGLASLLVGEYGDGKLLFAGKVGTGFSEKEKLSLPEKFAPLVRKTSPFASLPKGYGTSAVWLEPEIAVQTEFAEITAAGLLRQASYKGLREDKRAKEVTRERAEPSPSVRRRSAEKKETVRILGIPITHPEKLMFREEGITKGDLAEYYAAVAPRMLPHLKERALSLVCCPAGVGGEQFFRRRLEGEFAGVGIAEDGNFFVKSERGILSLAQYNAVEFHVQGAKKSTGKPDVMVFDLDPDEGLPLSAVRKGARGLAATLKELGLVSFLKTSGGKGYHLVVPFRTGTDPEKFKEFARKVAFLMEERFPDGFTANMSKKARQGKIFLDWQRNSSGATSAAPYSLRARKGAPVSAPIGWEELAKIAPDGISLKGALKRLSLPDPWADFFEVKQRQRLNL